MTGGTGGIRLPEVKRASDTGGASGQSVPEEGTNNRPAAFSNPEHRRVDNFATSGRRSGSAAVAGG